MRKPIINQQDRDWVINRPDSFLAATINLRIATLRFYREWYKQNPYVFIKSIGFINAMFLFADKCYSKLFKK